MRNIAIESDTLSTGWTVVTARIPPRVCGAPNTAATDRLKQVIATVDPAAFDPVPEAVAEAVIRDVIPPAEPQGYNPPPNCEGLSTAAVTSDDSTGRLPRASFPPFDDDEGAEAEPARYPPGVACNVTGECE